MRPIAILCNGPSLDDYGRKLSQLPCETIGLNGSWLVQRSSYHVMADAAQWEHFERTTGKPPSVIPHLYTGKDGPGMVKLEMLDTVQPRFSWHPLELGVYLCGTVSWVALQLAVSWKRNPIYWLGLDLSADKETGKEKIGGAIGQWDGRAEGRQRELMGYAAGLLMRDGLEIINVCVDETQRHRSKCWAFPVKTFAECFGTMEE